MGIIIDGDRVRRRLLPLLERRTWLPSLRHVGADSDQLVTATYPLVQPFDRPILFHGGLFSSQITVFRWLHSLSSRLPLHLRFHFCSISDCYQCHSKSKQLLLSSRLLIKERRERSGYMPLYLVCPPAL
jgi:hypothetical protein